MVLVKWLSGRRFTIDMPKVGGKVDMSDRHLEQAIRMAARRMTPPHRLEFKRINSGKAACFRVIEREPAAPLPKSKKKHKR